jgi:hypothetical protein
MNDEDDGEEDDEDDEDDEDVVELSKEEGLNELAELEKEGEMSIEELRAKYGH